MIRRGPLDPGSSLLHEEAEGRTRGRTEHEERGRPHRERSHQHSRAADEKSTDRPRQAPPDGSAREGLHHREHVGLEGLGEDPVLKPRGVPVGEHPPPSDARTGDQDHIPENLPGCVRVVAEEGTHLVLTNPEVAEAEPPRHHRVSPAVELQ